MSIEDTNKIDMIGKLKNNESVISLGITDHLSWNDEINNHLFLLQEKINSYLRFIESGEIYESFPAAKGKINFLIEIFFQYKIPQECINFLDKVNELLSSTNIRLKYEERNNC
ncbi:DUF6572 domain-containing protein [Gilliamella apis]|uniref:DUF6572 domain-containing protein n=2 Tax=Gilliamella apis TaxID=1970738 RepID=UPI000A3504E5|nr:DUF6572 domain-containing protein [Gilliamella apis]